PKCQSTYHVVSAPPKQDGVCDKCGTALVQRADDREETVKNRLRVYATQTAPLLDFYSGRNILTIVRGEGGIDQIRNDIRAAAGSRR
ncbi:MAG: adenylate kinase, partial [Candidatus Rokubacteria bacterium]|nr:adenylate kinase [Candidatus Rokubacteria bacterium]